MIKEDISEFAMVPKTVWRLDAIHLKTIGNEDGGYGFAMPDVEVDILHGVCLDFVSVWREDRYRHIMYFKEGQKLEATIKQLRILADTLEAKGLELSEHINREGRKEGDTDRVNCRVEQKGGE